MLPTVHSPRRPFEASNDPFLPYSDGSCHHRTMITHARRILLHLEDGRRVPIEPDEVFLLEADGDRTTVRKWKMAPRCSLFSLMPSQGRAKLRLSRPRAILGVYENGGSPHGVLRHLLVFGLRWLDVVRVVRELVPCLHNRVDPGLCPGDQELKCISVLPVKELKAFRQRVLVRELESRLKFPR